MNARFALRRFLVALAAAATTAPQLQAGFMLSPTAVLGTDLGTFDPNAAPLENMINQSGIDKPFTSGVADFDEYFTTGDPAFGQGGFDWQSDFSFNLPLMGFIDFDLGDVYTIDRIAIWNRSLETGNFLVSQTLGGPFDNAGSFALQNRLNFPFSYFSETVELDQPVEARYLRFEITSTYKFDITDTFAYAIVGEVVLDVVSDAVGLPGDFDLDHDVDGDDLLEWQAAYGLTADADADGDGDSDGDDVLVWQRNVGRVESASAVAAAVPEPASMAIVATASATLIGRMRSRSAARVAQTRT